MACAVGSSKMAIMERLLMAGSFSQNVTGKFDHQKLVQQYIHRVLCEADEANLLDEKDMHIFGLKPMEDPVCLVCCNTCRRPIKASQYKAHVGFCTSLITPELLSEPDSVAAGKKKPLRKERKKAVTARSQKSSTGGQERPKIGNAAHPAASGSYIAEQNGKMPPVLPDPKDDVQRGANFGSTNSNCATRPRTGKPAAAIIPPSKRTKLIVADTQPTSDGTGIVQDVSNTINRQTYSSYPVAPLATKIYYSQRNNYLRTSLGRMYHGIAEGGCIGNEQNHNVFEGHLISSTCTSSKIISDEQMGSSFLEVRGEAETAESCIFSHSAQGLQSKPI